MRRKIYYLTRSFAPYQKGGGPLMRKAAVEYLRQKGWDVTVVMPEYESSEISGSDVLIKIPFTRNKRLAILLEMVGLYEDYLDQWVEDSFAYLVDKIKQNDIVFATSGGELGTVKLGSLLKKERGCKFVVNFRDPIDYTEVNGMKINDRFHISREKAERKYIENADLIVTSSSAFEKHLAQKYPHLASRIVTNYFGYTRRIDLGNDLYRSADEKLRVAYVGNMESAQKPELLLEIYQHAKRKTDIELFFIGDTSNYAPLQKVDLPNVHILRYMPHEALLTLMLEKIDVGFVSLASPYYGVCFPSKIYEYLNLGLPVLGALPEGDAKTLINERGYGFAYQYDEIERLSQALDRLTNKELYRQIRQRVLRERGLWSMEVKIEELDKLLKEIG